jgi:aldehyde:ferredoxin oxidoreductase
MELEMPPGEFGYNGTFLRVDVSSMDTHVETPSANFWRIHVGGGLLAARILLDQTEPGVDPLAPESPLILASSIVAGHPYPALQRFTVACKSPLTGGIGETRCEGPFAGRLKASGFDAIVVEGLADQPSILVVEGGEARIESAESLWGLGTAEADDLLVQRFGADTGRAVIGPAGESLVRYAGIVANRDHLAARMGIGAVMGSKRLKAIVLCGGELPPVARPEACAATVPSYAARIAGNDLTRWQHEPPGFAAWVHLLGEEASLCTRNFRDSVFESASGYAPEAFLRRFDGDAACPGCPNDCIKRFLGRGINGDISVHGIHQEVTVALGANIGLTNAEDMLDLNALCMDLGMDPVSLGFTVSMVMECLEVGVLSTEEVGVDLRFGNVDATRQMMLDIAARKGFGDTLAEGVYRAAAQIGNGAERFALHVKGLEMVPVEPRCQTNLALGFATAPIGPRYDICEHDWDFDTSVGWSHTMELSRTLGILDLVPMQELSLDKVRIFKALNTLWSAADALGLCIFGIAPTRILSVEEMAAMVSNVTGIDFSSWELMRVGERRNAIMRLYNHREGIGSEHDTLPDRFFDDPIPQGRWAGVRLDRADFEASVEGYYRMSGYDTEGLPTLELLTELNLGDLAAVLP